MDGAAYAVRKDEQRRARMPGAALPSFLRKPGLQEPDDSMFTGAPGNMSLADPYRAVSGAATQAPGWTFAKQGLTRGSAKPAVNAAPIPQSFMENGGDTRVTREAPIRSTPANIAGGVDRDELIRRMQNAGRYMVGSPSARAAMMGVYGEQLKALDEGALQDNKGNIDNAQLGYQQNMEANRQEADGRRQFGNLAGLQERKFLNDMELAKASNYVDPEERALKLEKMRTEILTGKAAAANSAAETDAKLPGIREKLYMDKIGALTKLGVTPEEAKAQVLSEMALSGNLDQSTSLGAAEIQAQGRDLGTEFNKGNRWWDQALSGEEVNMWSDPQIDVNAATPNDFTLDSDVGGLAAFQNAVFKDGIMRLNTTDTSGKKVSKLLKGPELERTKQIIAAREIAKKRREAEGGF